MQNFWFECSVCLIVSVLFFMPHEVVIYKDTKLSVRLIKDNTLKAYGEEEVCIHAF